MHQLSEESGGGGSNKPSVNLKADASNDSDDESTLTVRLNGGNERLVLYPNECHQLVSLLLNEATNTSSGNGAATTTTAGGGDAIDSLRISSFNNINNNNNNIDHEPIPTVAEASSYNNQGNNKIIAPDADINMTCK